MEKEFYITSTITIMAKSREEVIKLLDDKNEYYSVELLRNAEVDEGERACEGCGELLLVGQAISGDRHSACS